MEKRKVMMDTSAYAAFLRGSRGVEEAVQQADEIVFNPVVLGELKAGFSPVSAMQHGLRVLTTDKHYLEVSQIITEFFEAE